MEKWQKRKMRNVGRTSLYSIRMGMRLIFVSHGTLGYVTPQRAEFMEKSSFAETFILKGCGFSKLQRAA